MYLVDWLALNLFGQKDHCMKSAQGELFYLGYELIK